MSVDYDVVAGSYSKRYEQNDYAGVWDTLTRFVGLSESRSPQVLEVGCGTGHWLSLLGGRGVRTAGSDLSTEMLRLARVAAPQARLTRARAEALPWRQDSFDRLVCVNALHHFTNQRAFFAEARRILRPGGGILVVGLDPHTGQDKWWIYKYFPETKHADRLRYPSSEAIRMMMEGAGFERCATHETQLLASMLSIAEAKRRGVLDRTSTSQLMLVTDDQYQQGRAQLLRADVEAAGTLILEADLRLYATLGWCGSA